MEKRNWQDWGFDPKQVHVLFLTLPTSTTAQDPQAVKDGFQGRNPHLPPTAELCRIMLLDSAHVQEMDAEWQSRKNRRRNRTEILPLYTTEDAEESLRYHLLWRRTRSSTWNPASGPGSENAGHILDPPSWSCGLRRERSPIKIVFPATWAEKPVDRERPHEGL